MAIIDCSNCVLVNILQKSSSRMQHNTRKATVSCDNKIVIIVIVIIGCDSDNRIVIIG